MHIFNELLLIILDLVTRFDPHSCYVFMGDRSGEIHVFKLGEEQSLKAITTLKGHSGKNV